MPHSENGLTSNSRFNRTTGREPRIPRAQINVNCAGVRRLLWAGSRAGPCLLLSRVHIIVMIERQLYGPQRFCGVLAPQWTRRMLCSLDPVPSSHGIVLRHSRSLLVRSMDVAISINGETILGPQR